MLEDYRNINREVNGGRELLLLLYIVSVSIIIAWAMSAAKGGIASYVASVTLLSPAFLFTYRKILPTDKSHTKLTLTYLLYMIPAWYYIAVYLVSFVFPASEKFFLGNSEVLRIITQPLYYPASIRPELAWKQLFLEIGLYAASINIILLINRPSIFFKILRILAVNAVILSIIGILQHLFGAENILFFIDPGREDFFSLFVDSSQWAAFAMLWLITIGGIAMHDAHSGNLEHVFRKRSVTGLIGATLLLISIYLSGHYIYFCISGAALSIIFMDFWKTSYYSRSMKTLGKHIYGLSALFTLFITISTLGQLFYPIKEVSSEQFESRQIVIKEGLDLFQEKPLWGWGHQSYNSLLAFSTDKIIETDKHKLSQSTIITALVERGIFGILIWSIVPIILVFKLMYGKTLRPLSIVLLSASAAGIILSFYVSPFSSAAFTISFWVITISAFGWSLTVLPEDIKKKRNSSESDNVDGLSPYESYALDSETENSNPNRFK